MEVCGGCMRAVDLAALHIQSLAKAGALHLHDDGATYEFRPLKCDEEPTIEVAKGTWLVMKTGSC